MEFSKSLLKAVTGLFLLCLPPVALQGEVTESEEAEAVNKHHILYLVQCQKIDAAIDLYQRYRSHLGRHDFETLQHIAHILLEQGARSDDPEDQLLSLFGSGIAGLSSCNDVLESGLHSPHPQTQVTAIQFLGRMNDDTCDRLLNHAMRSDFFAARMEAAYLLAEHKHRTAVGQIEALMHKVPPPFRSFFPELFALIGTSDAISILRRLMDDPDQEVRVQSILSAAQYGRDDLLPVIRAAASHLNMAQQEASATALGVLKDSKSVPHLRKLADSPSFNVSLAASRALYQLGETSFQEKILKEAKEQNPFAITMLGDISGTEETLASLIRAPDIHTRLNAAIALLNHKDPRCLPALYEILIRDTRDLGFQPSFSLGRSLFTWKIVSSAQQHQKDAFFDFQAISLQLREQLLVASLELPEKAFLTIAEQLFKQKQLELIPLLVALLQNIQTPEAIELLKTHAKASASPLIRHYCYLALFRLKQAGPYEKSISSWIDQVKKTQMIRFRPMVPFNLRQTRSTFELTPEESSRLLIESYQAFADRHDEQSIDILLEGIKTGNPKNRSALAGLILRAIE